MKTERINHIQIQNIADHLKTQKYALNKQRAETILKYVKQTIEDEKKQEKKDKLLGLYLNRKKIVNRFAYDYDYTDIDEEIKALEEELK